jgi:hypothetical protein
VVRSTQVKRCKRRHIEQAKGADRLGPKGKWSGWSAPNSLHADVVPPAQKHDLTHPIPHGERGKPVALRGMPPEGEPQGDLTGQRVEEEGASEGRLVTGRIGVATLPHPKGGRLPSGVGARDRTANRLWAAKQICRRDGNRPCWCGCHHRVLSGAGSVRGNVQVASRPMRTTACSQTAECVVPCLSRMRQTSHVRF